MSTQARLRREQAGDSAGGMTSFSTLLVPRLSWSFHLKPILLRLSGFLLNRLQRHTRPDLRHRVRRKLQPAEKFDERL